MTVCAKITYIATIYKSQGCEFNKMIGKWTHWKSRLRLSILTANGESGVYTWTFGCMHARRATQLQHESSHGCGITWLRVSSRSQFIYKLTICRPFIAKSFPILHPRPKFLVACSGHRTHRSGDAIAICGAWKLMHHCISCSELWICGSPAW